MRTDSQSPSGLARGRRVVGVCAVVGLFVGVVGYGYLAWLADRPAEPAEQRERALLKAAVARIDAESQGVSPLAVSGPPRPAEAQGGASPDAADVGAAEEVAPWSSEGHSSPAVEWEMAKAPMPEGELDEPEGADDGLDWLGAPDAIPALTQQAAAAGRDWSFGWVRAAPDARPDAARAALEELGVEVLGASGRLLRAKLPGDRASLQAIAALPQVAGLGAVPKERKAPAGFVKEVLAAPAYERTPVFITLMTDDPQGRWRRRLEALGAVVGRFDPDIRAYAAHIDNTALDAIASQDFVLAVEPIGIVRATHDTAVPAMGADAVRRYRGSPGLFSGPATGASAPIAVMDTGLNINHLDISMNRESVCGANFVWFDPRVDDADLWVDDNGHGTHVTGTIAGNGYAEPRYAGMAPGVRHIRFAKVLDHGGSGAGDSILRGMDYLARPSGCAEAGWSSARVKPLIVNMSLGYTARIWQSRSVDERKLDSVVWSHRQLYVVAQDNASINGFSAYAAAKNSLAVGAILDSGDLAYFSSLGPTRDGRLAPQIVATGVGLYSAAGGGSRGRYVGYSGTSMSAPSAAGVAALLMDGLPAHQEQPALTRARLMASAVKPDVWLDAPNRFPADNSMGPGSIQARYGLGKASARTSILNRNRADGWVSGGAVSEMSEGEYAHLDIEVPENASRLDLVLTWDEPPTDTIGQAVLNDLDLWLDLGGDCGSAACGERSSTSRKDNVEWIILRDPAPGTYRAKILPRRIHGAAPRAALAWTLIRGPATPQLRIEANKSDLNGGGPHDLTLTLTADGYVAAGTRLHFACDAEDLADCEDVRISSFNGSREDGITNASANILADAPAEIPWGASVELGEIVVGESQEVSFQLAANKPTPMRLYATASAWNAEPAFASIGMNGSDSATAPAAAEHPANDGFAAAAVLEGRNGTLALDLRLTTAEPGEPLFDAFAGRPAGSLWHVWTAPTDGLAQFGVQLAEADAGEDEDDQPEEVDGEDEEPSAVKVDVFQGDHIAGLVPVAAKLWGASFFADQGETYRIRVSHAGTGLPLTLHWLQGPRPANDDFRQAVTLTGAAGSAEGSNQGATLQPGEQFGSLAATTWHRWQAPTDGVWQFKADHGSARLLAFTGNAVADLRLVSGYPSRSISFPARAGEIYRIAVAAEDAFAGGRRYRLTWGEGTPSDDNDDFANAEEISGASSSIGISLEETTSVEPGEPVATGVRTRWWRWTAPEDGRYTWRLVNTPHTELQVTAFAAPTGQVEAALENLQLVGTTGPEVTSTEFAFNAAAERRYWFAVGYAAGDLGAFQWPPNAFATLAWGAAPEHDALANAAALSGAAGELRGSNAFATAERGEPIGREGHSSLWWTWEAPASGWYRFWVGEGASHTLGAYQAGGDGFAGLDPIANSHVGWLGATAGPFTIVYEGQEDAATEILFYAEPGVRYSVRLGTASDASGGEFRLQWGEAAAPVWIKYAGRLSPAQLGLAQGNTYSYGMAFDDLGTTLYMQSDRGLRVLGRDAASGALTPVQVIENGLPGASVLVWDAQRTKLYAGGRCDAWHRFAPIGDNRRELRSDPFATADTSSFCTHTAFMDPDGKFLYSVSRSGIEVFAFESSDGLRHVQSLEVDSLERALISNSGQYVYAAATFQGVFAFQRNAATGELTQVSTALTDSYRTDAFSVSDDERYLFTFSAQGDTQIYQLSGDPVNAQLLQTLRSHEAPWFNLVLTDFSENTWTLTVPHQHCKFSLIRHDRPAADLFCDNGAISTEYRPPAAGTEEPGELKSTDYISHWQPGRFNNQLPKFDSLRNLAPSPDGKHAYLLTDESELLFFERVGNQLVNASPSPDAPDLAVGIIETDNSSPEPGAPFSLQARVRNRGGVASAATTLRWLRSADALISLEDEEAASNPVEALAAFEDSTKTATLTAPVELGDYYYGACVDSVADESNTGNNCSVGALFRVTMPDDDSDDHGDSRETATDVTVPSSTAGSLESPGDLDYFRITLQQAATLELQTTGSTDTYGSLYRENGSLIATDDDGGNNVNFRITSAFLAAGTYFLEVRGFSSSTTGSYSLEAAFSESDDGGDDGDDEGDDGDDGDGGGDDGGDGDDDGDDHGDSRETATDVTVPSSTAGSLESPGDLDYFRITLQQAATLELQTTGGTDTYGSLYREDGSLIATDDDGGNNVNFRITSAFLAAGTYFLEVRGFSSSTTGSYSLEAAFSESDDGGDDGDDGDDGGDDGDDGGGSDDGDDHGDSRETATDVTVPSSTAGSLESPGDLDYFRITLQQAATLELQTTGSTDTYGSLYRENGSLIATDDDGGNNVNFRITSAFLAAGTYFLEVRGFSSSTTGSYSLEAAFSESDDGGDDGDDEGDDGDDGDGGGDDGGDGDDDGDDHGDSRETATDVTVPSSTAGSLESPGDLDYFRITLQQAATLELQTTGGTDTYGSLYREDGSLIATNDDGGNNVNFRITSALAAGTYFLEVIHNGHATRLRRPSRKGDGGDDGDDEGDDGDDGDGGGDDGGDGDDDGDDHGDSRETATDVTVPSSTAGSLESPGDLDYFRIVLQQAGTLELRTTGSVDTCGVLYWEDGRSINESCDGPDGDNFRIRRNLPTGTYFIKVHGYDATETGAYSLEVSSYDSGDNHSDFRETATEVAVPSTTAGNLEPSRDSDYFRIVLQQPATLELHTTGDTDTYGVLYRSDGSSITENDDGGTANNFRISRNLAAGTYFLEVRGADIWETGAYSLEAAFAGSDDGDDDGDDHGDSRETATEVAVPSSTAGSLETSGDLDYFRIILQRAATLDLRTTGSVDTYGSLYGEDGSLIAANDDGGINENFRITSALEAGTYFVEVEGFGSSDTGDYRLEAAFANGGGDGDDGDDDGDDHGDGRGTATEVAVPSSTAGSLETSGDSDYFRIVLQQAATLELHTTGSTDTWGNLYREDGSFITENDDGDAALNFRITHNLGAGTYFLEVRGYDSTDTGEYSLEAAFADEG